MENVLNTLLSIPKSALYALVNRHDNCIYLAYSTNVFMSLALVFQHCGNKEKKYRKLNEDLGKCELVVLFESKKVDDLIQQYSYYYDYYNLLGYTHYRKYKGKRYKIRTDIKDDKVFVSLETSRKNTKVVGVFDKMKDANEFIATHYTSDYLKPVYAKNELTKSYMESER